MKSFTHYHISEGSGSGGEIKAILHQILSKHQIKNNLDGGMLISTHVNVLV